MPAKMNKAPHVSVALRPGWNQAQLFNAVNDDSYSTVLGDESASIVVQTNQTAANVHGRMQWNGGDVNVYYECRVVRANDGEIVASSERKRGKSGVVEAISTVDMVVGDEFELHVYASSYEGSLVYPQNGFFGFGAQLGTFLAVG